MSFHFHRRTNSSVIVLLKDTLQHCIDSVLILTAGIDLLELQTHGKSSEWPTLQGFSAFYCPLLLI